MRTSINQLLARRTDEGFFGRDAELLALGRLLDEDGPVVFHLFGIGGIGKSRLLDAFAAHAQMGGATVLSLDCRAIEPTERGFLAALADRVGAGVPTIAAVAQQIGTLGQRVVLTLDTFEVFRLLDAWLRQVFIPALDTHVRVLLVGREPPTSAWSIAPGWHGLFRSLALGPLDPEAAQALLLHARVAKAEAQRISRFACGHPLALQLAATAATERLGVDMEVTSIQRVVAELTQLYLADIHDPLARRALRAASVVRRITISLLGAMLPDASPQHIYDLLAALPIVQRGHDGLLLHDVVRQAIAADLKAADPATYRVYRQAAWQQLRAEVQAAGRHDLWRYTADMLYLVEAPFVHEVFFPSGTTAYAVEPAGPESYAVILSICARHGGPEGRAQIEHWLARAPQAFYIARGRDNAVAGFYCLLLRADIAEGDLQADPVTRAWCEHLRNEPVEQHEHVLFLRSLLSLGRGDGPSETNAALMLDLKRTYMELRPQLRRIYTVVADLSLYGPFLKRTGFRLLPEQDVRIDGRALYSALLDFGPRSVDGWLANLVAAELTSASEDAVALDVDGRELIVDGQRIGLAQLEFSTLRYLLERPEKAVSRAELLDSVWGYTYDGGSNVVDVVVRSLRKKLGVRAMAIETVTKVGYRFRHP